MEVIIIGLESANDKSLLEKEVLNSGTLQVVWDFEKCNIESNEGIKLLKKEYNLKYIGILLEKEFGDFFTSYPLIDEISEFALKGGEYPRLFDFFDQLQDSKICKIIVAFADEWDEETLVRVQKSSCEKIKRDLNNIYTWCETLVDIKRNMEIRISDHPLIVEIEL